MPRGKGKANYKVGLLIEVIEEKLPQGSLGWQEVAALYQFRSQETILRDHEDIKRYWSQKLCNKFKKPTGHPGDPVRDQILRCQRIHARILAKSASAVMGAASDEDSDVEEEEEEAEDNEDDEEEEVDEKEEEEVVIQETQQQPYDPDMTQLDPVMPPLNAPPLSASDLLSLNVRRQELARLYNENNPGVTLSLPPILPNTTAAQQLRSSPTLQQQQQQQQQPSTIQQPTLLQQQQQQPSTGLLQQQQQQQPTTATKKSKRKASEVSAATPTPLSNAKTKNSASEKRGSIVKSIDKLASSIAGDGVANNNNEAAAAASMMQQFTAQMNMQMQMQAFSAQMQIQMERQSNMMRDQMEGNQRMMRAVLKQLKKKKKKKKRRSGPKFTLDSNATPVGNAGRGGNSSSSSSSSEGYSSYG